MGMKTQSDKPTWTCFTCRFASNETFILNDQECIECRRNHPGDGSFPIMNVNSYCWDGLVSTTYVNTINGGK